MPSFLFVSCVERARARFAYILSIGGKAHAHHIWWFYLKKTNILIPASNADFESSKCEKQDLHYAL